MWIYAALTLAVATHVSTSAAAQPPLQRAAQEILAEHFEADGPGAVVALVKNGQPLVVAARGLANVDAETPLTATSVFDLASVSKQFTAAAILALEADGEIELDAPVSRYVEDFEVETRGREITVEDLLRHVSGLVDYTSDEYEDGDEDFAKLTPETHLVWLNGTQPQRAPGKRFEYNNSGYALLALVVERVSGQSYTAFVTARLFRRAGMRDTQVLDYVKKRIRGRALGYTTAEGSVERSEIPSQITGDGNVFSSVHDMIAWGRALAGGRVLPAAALRRMWTSGTFDSGAPIDEDGSGYGYGWWIEDDHVHHDGSWSGTATFLGYSRERDLWVVVLSNDEDADVASIAEALAALVD